MAGDLYSKIIAHKKAMTSFSETELWSYFVQMTSGLAALHSKSILHRDIKSANVFVDHCNVVKLGDMNVSKICKDGLLFTQTGTPYYASPEVWRDQPYDHKSDIWSLGCVLYEMAALTPPFVAPEMEKLFQAVTSGAFERLPRYSNNLNRIIKLLLQVNPIKRPSCSQLLSLKVIVNYKSEMRPPLQNTAMLKTIYVPKNLSKLSTVLPPA